MKNNTTLNKDEQEVMDELLTVMDRIQKWGLIANPEELSQAVHVIQGFVVQHMLERVNPEAWSAWYEDIEATG